MYKRYLAVIETSARGRWKTIDILGGNFVGTFPRQLTAMSVPNWSKICLLRKVPLDSSVLSGRDNPHIKMAWREVNPRFGIALDV